MPLYDFRCNKCETVHQELQSMSETKSEMPLQCEKCGAETDHTKVIGAPYVPFKLRTGRDFKMSEMRKTRDKHWKMRVTGRK